MASFTCAIIAMSFLLLQQQLDEMSAVITVPDLTIPKCYVKEGDINLAVFTQVYKAGTDGQFCVAELESGASIQAVEAVVWAIELLNNNYEILPNISLGYIIMDDCGQELTAIAQSLAFLPEGTTNEDLELARESQCQPRRRQFNVAGALGLEESNAAIAVSNILSLFKVPFLSTFANTYGAHGPTQTNKYFFTLHPTMESQALAIIDVLNNFDWTYVILLYSEGQYGESGSHYMQKYANRICFAMVKEILSGTTNEEIDDILDSVENFKNARVIVLFLEKSDLEMLLDNAQSRDMESKYVWVGSNTLAEVDLQVSLEAFSVSPQLNISRYFAADYRAKTPANNPSNPWMLELWESLYNCSWQTNSCQKYHALSYPDQSISPRTSKYIDAVEVFARAFHQLITRECPVAFNHRPIISDCISNGRVLKYMADMELIGLNGLIEFGKGNIIGGLNIKYYLNSEWITISSYDGKSRQTMFPALSYFQWEIYSAANDTKTKVPLSICSKPCTIKQYKEKGLSPCCWTCVECALNQFIKDNSSCVDCPFAEWPDETLQRTCEPIPYSYLDWGDPEGVALWFVAILGMICCIVTAVLYFLNREHKLLQASNLELSGITLVGALLTYMTMLIMIGKPNKARCGFERFGFDNALAILVVPLMVKANTAYRILQASQKSKRDVAFIGRTSQLVFCIGVLLLQVILTTLSMVVVPPEVKTRMPYPRSERLVELHCHMPVTGLILPLLYNLGMVLLCAHFGFSTRKLTDNFYETRCIFGFACTTWILWLVFMPTYFATKYQFDKILSLEICLFFNATLVLFFIFLPKLIAIYFIKDEKIKLTTTHFVAHPVENESSHRRRKSSEPNHSKSATPNGEGPSNEDGMGGLKPGTSDEAAIMARYAKTGRRKSSQLRAIRNMKVSTVESTPQSPDP